MSTKHHVDIHHEEDDATEYDPVLKGTPSTTKKTSSVFNGTNVFLLLNTLVLLLILGTVGTVYKKVDKFLDNAERITNVFVQPTPDPVLVNNVNKFASAATSAFFFGAANGSVPVFLRDSVFGFNFGSFGSNMAHFANQLFDTMSLVNPPASCNQMVTCAQGGPMTCPNGQQNWCDYQGQQVNCATDYCIAGSVASAASLVEGIATKVGKLSAVHSDNDGAQPAFSNGLLRVDEALNWVGKQANMTQWKQAAKACQRFSFGVNNVDWSGVYFDAQGVKQTWNANYNVQAVLGYVNQVCDPIASIGDAKKEDAKKDKN